MKIIFFGTSPFAAKILECLLRHSVPIVAVVTRTDKPKGRSLKVAPPPVKEMLVKSFPEMRLLQPVKASTPEFTALLKSLHPDLFIVAAYGEILKSFLLDLPPLGAINAHPSLLPKYRGAAPIQRCLMKGETETGVTIMQLVLEMDAGDMLATSRVHLSPDITYGELEHKLADISCPLLINVLAQIENETLHPVPQDAALVTFAPKITPEETQIEWDRPASEIHNQIRALSPHPGAWCFVRVGTETKRLKIKKSRVVEAKGYPGDTVVFSEKEWVVAAAHKGISLLEVQLEGKKTLSIGEFLRGISEPILKIS